MTRQQRRWEARKGVRVPGFTAVRNRRSRARYLVDGGPVQRFEPLPNGGYRTYHPTKGWRVVSPKRLRRPFPGTTA